MYALNTGLYRSRDGGETFPGGIRVPHGDNHDLWIAPDDSDRMVNANDGGANVTFNGGRSWTDQDYSTAQFYRVTTTNHLPYHICGGQQDNSTACIPVRGWNHMAARGPGDRTWYYAVGGCESGYIAPHPVDLDIFYAGCYGGSLSRFDMATGARRAIHVWPENPMGQSSEDLVERVQWTFPIVFSHHDPDVLYTGTQKVWKTTTEGQSWEEISPDLTRADPATMGPSGGPITKDQTGVETYATVFAIAPSYHDPEVIWAGVGRWPCPHHPERRRGLDEGDAARRARLRAHQHHRGFAEHGRESLRVGHPLPGRRRPQPLHLEDRGLRAVVDEDRRRPAGGRLHPRDPGGSEASRPAVRRLGAYGVRVLRRRSPLAAPLPEPPGRPGLGSGGRGERPGDRDARTVLLGARGHRAAPADG